MFGFRTGFDRVGSIESSSAEGFKPAADINLRVGLAAVVPRVGSAGCFRRPFENRKLSIAAMDHNPAHRILAFRTADFTLVIGLNHRSTPNNLNWLNNAVSNPLVPGGACMNPDAGIPQHPSGAKAQYSCAHCGTTEVVP